MADREGLEAKASRLDEDLTGSTVGRFSVRVRLGSGGMGEVYRADDTKLKRPVALKRMAPEVRADERYRRRFLHEAERASALNDPHIAAVYDVLEQDGELFLVMEHVEGQTLRCRLTAKALGLAELVAIAAQCAEGLAAAARKRIVHHDIKPENIMLTPAGQAKILDFGVAKRVMQAEEGTTTTSTESTIGGLSGTVAYMAPEMLLQQEADTRSDIFSLGVVLYEALTGEHPFRAGTFIATSDRILHELPVAPSRLNPRVPAELERIVTKMLAKDPRERYATAADLAVDLRAVERAFHRGVPVPPKQAAPSRISLPKGLYVAAALLLVVAALWWALAPQPRARVESLAVLPLENLSGDPEQDYFADGMTEALIMQLSRVHALHTISRTSVMRYRATEKSLPQIGRDLNVDSLVVGSVQHAGNRIRINVQLNNARTDRALWAASYERDLEAVLALQSEVAQAIADEIQVQLSPEERAQLQSPRRVNPAAHEAYLKGRYYWNKRTPDGVRKGLEYFQQATQLDPTFALAYVGVADSYAVHPSLPGREAVARQKAAALKALELEPNLAEAHTSLADAKDKEWDWSGAEQEYRRAIQLNPNYATARHWYSIHLNILGRHEEAIAEAKRAVELDPLSLIVQANLGGRLLYARHYDEAIEQCQRPLEMDPMFAPAHDCVGWAYIEKAEFDRAIAAFRRAVEIAPDDADHVGSLGHAYAKSGRRALAEGILEQLGNLGAQGAQVSYHIATIHAGLGQTKEAFRWLEEAYRQGDGWLPFVMVDPRQDPLHGDPRFDALLRRLGLGAEQDETKQGE